MPTSIITWNPLLEPQDSKSQILFCKKSHTSTHEGMERVSYWNVKCACCFSYISSDLMIEIMTYLPHEELLNSISLVSKRFKFISEAPYLWNSVRLNAPSDGMFDAIMSRFGDYIRELRINRSRLLNDTTMEQGLKKASSITFLQTPLLHKVSPKTLIETLGGLINLTHLNMFGTINFNDKVLSSLQLQARNMKALHFGYTSITSEGLIDTFTTITFGSSSSSSINSNNNKVLELETIDVRGCVQVKNHAVETLIQQTSKLTSLRISGSGCSLTNDLATALAIHCPALETLDAVSSDTFTGNNLIQDSTLKLLLQRCDQINRLFIAGCNSLTEESMKFLHRSNNKQRLIELDISMCSSISRNCVMNIILSHKSTLEFVDVSGIDVLTQDDTAKISAMLSEKCTFNCY
jgi:hypothetical protein